MFAIRGETALEMFTLRAEAGDHPPHKRAAQVIAVAIFFRLFEGTNATGL